MAIPIERSIRHNSLVVLTEDCLMSKNKKKVLLVFGTRPEAIKMAPLFHSLEASDVEPLVCVTAQHREMLDQVLDVFNITPHIDLDLMKSGQDLFDVTTAVLGAMRDVLRDTVPDMLLVHGDTTTTLACSMAGFYSGTPVGHVEAGLRTYDLHSPYPEEFNRQVTSKLTTLHFAPTRTSQVNLLKEGADRDSIFVTGNTVIDSLFWILQRLENDITRKTMIEETLTQLIPFSWKSMPYVLITGHRRENFGEGFIRICEALQQLAARFSNIHFLYPVHLNPNVRGPVMSMLRGASNIHLIEPVDYEPFVYLLKHCHLVLTDSGGIQEEAPSLGKPVLVMREQTERPEAVQAGTVRLVGTNREKIIQEVTSLLEDQAVFQAMSLAHNPYGDGQACRRIVDVLETRL